MWRRLWRALLCLHVEYPTTVTLITQQQQAFHLKDRFFHSRTCSSKNGFFFNFLNELSPSAGVTGLPCPRNDQSQHDGTNTAYLRRGAAADLHPDAPGLVSALSEFPAVQAGHPAECGPVMTSRSVCSFPTSFDRSRAFFIFLWWCFVRASQPTRALCSAKRRWLGHHSCLALLEALQVKNDRRGLSILRAKTATGHKNASVSERKKERTLSSS